MKSEEIIQRLLDEKHINVEEAMTLMRDIIGEHGIQYISTPFPTPIPTPVPTPITPYYSNPISTDNDNSVVYTDTSYKTE